MFENRYLAAAVSIFAIGVVFGINADASGVLYCCAVLAVVCVISVSVCRYASRAGNGKLSLKAKVTALAVAFFILGTARVGLYDLFGSFYSVYDGKTDIITVKVTDTGDYAGSSVVCGRIEESTLGVPDGTKVKLYTDADMTGMRIGDSYSCSAGYETSADIEPNDDAIRLSGSACGGSFTEGSGLLYSIRTSVCTSCEKLFSGFAGEASAVASAVTAGDRSGLDSYFFSLYSNAGISHLLAISGLHISLIAMGLYELLSVFGVSRRIRCIISSLLAIGYSAMLGFSASTLRAAVMLSIMLLSRLFMRRADGMTSLFFAFFLILIFNPYAIVSVGLQLSFLCCFSVQLVTPAVRRIKQWNSDSAAKSFFAGAAVKLASAVSVPALVSFSCAVFSFPVLYYSFDSVSYVSPITNIIALPLFSFALTLTLAAIPISFLLPQAAAVIAYPAGLIYESLTDAAKYIYDAGIGSVSLHMTYMLLPLLFAVGVAISLLFLRERRVIASVICSVLFVFSITGCAIGNNLNLSDRVILEAGTGDAEYVYFACNRENIFIDLGGKIVSNDVVFRNGEVAVGKYLITSLDGESVRRLSIMSGKMKIGKLIVPSPATDEEYTFYNEIKQLANQRNCDIIKYKENYTCLVSEAKLSIYLTDGMEHEEIMLMVKAGDRKLALLGDNDGGDVPVVCDTAVALPGYGGSRSAIQCIRLCELGRYADYADDNHFAFENSVRVEYKLPKGEPDIYEP